MTQFSKLVVFVYACAYAVGSVNADVYMHMPRGNNNRACRNDNNTNRRNGNRLFDSQNNDKGGYSCPRAYPFACYAPNNNCNNNADAQALTDGTLAVGNGQQQYLTNTAKQYYYAGSILPIEWTNQHGGGTNTKLHTEVVIQYACEDTLADGQSGPRDGSPITNNSGNNRDDEASDTIPTNNNQQNDYRYGRHESLEFYNRCTDTERNKGLLTLDQNLQGNTAQYTRQNPNGNRNGLECPEESEYYPYWNPSPWKDLAILTDDVQRCQTQIAPESQNVKTRGYCTLPNGNNNDIPITEAGCTQEGGTWAQTTARNLPAPTCALGPWTRHNHLGNAGAGAVPGQQAGFNITVPQDMAGKDNCIIRLRYNMSTGDTANNQPITATTKEITVDGDKTDNDAIYDRNNNEVKSYLQINGGELGTAVNTNQYGRTFQDRSFVFQVKAAPTGAAKCAGQAIHNLNVRGKRGNIVQTYPSVEYDFTPNVLDVETKDCVHVQFYGSDYNPNRNPNNGEGGPPNPNNDNEAKADRTNMVPVQFERTNFPQTNVASDPGYATATKMFSEDVDTVFKKLAFLDQDVGGNGCLNINQLRAIIGGDDAADREERERDSRNCGKLSGQKTPAFDGGLVTAGAVGNHAYISTRNNNLTNRGQKGIIKVVPEGATGAGPDKLPNNANNNFGSAGAAGDVANNLAIAGGVAGGLVALGAAFVAYRKMSNNRAMAGGAMAPTAAAAGGSTVTARYAHNAKEAGELSFQKGEQITVTRKDASGWWEGQLASGARGVFPSNYVQ